MIVHDERPTGSRVTSLGSVRVSRFVSDIDIPSRPLLRQKLDTLGDDIQKVSILVMQDPAMSAAVLKIVNSAWFALQNQVFRIDQAVYLLGLENIRTIIRAVCFRTVSEKINEPKLMKIFWSNSFKVALCASTIAKFLHLGCKDMAYACGMFHNAGLPILSSHFGNILSVTDSAYKDSAGKISKFEKNSIGVSHAEIGAKLASSWNLPTPIVEAIAQHHSIETINFDDYSEVNHLLVALKLAENFTCQTKEYSGITEEFEWLNIKKQIIEYAALTVGDITILKNLCSETLLGCSVSKIH